jgi:hypothetical protein
MQVLDDPELVAQVGADLTVCLAVFRGLALHVADDPAQPGANHRELAVHALELLGVGIPARLQLGRLTDPGMTLAQHDTRRLRRADQSFAGPLDHTGIACGIDRMRQ